MTNFIETIAARARPSRIFHSAVTAWNNRAANRSTMAKLRDLDDHMLRQFGLSRVQVGVLN